MPRAPAHIPLLHKKCPTFPALFLPKILIRRVVHMFEINLLEGNFLYSLLYSWINIILKRRFFMLKMIEVYNMRRQLLGLPSA